MVIVVHVRQTLRWLPADDLPAFSLHASGGLGCWPLSTALFGSGLPEPALVPSTSLQYLYQLWPFPRHWKTFLLTSHLFFVFAFTNSRDN